MCGACGRNVVSDPVLGPVRTMRQHLIVAQTINSACQSWPGAPKVAASSDGWLVSGPTGATEAVATVEAVWSAVLRGSPGARFPDLRRALGGSGGPVEPGAPGAPAAAENPGAAAGPGGLDPEDLSLRVLMLGQHMTRDRGKDSAAETNA